MEHDVLPHSHSQCMFHSVADEHGDAFSAMYRLAGEPQLLIASILDHLAHRRRRLAGIEPHPKAERRHLEDLDSLCACHSTPALMKTQQRCREPNKAYGV